MSEFSDTRARACRAIMRFHEGTGPMDRAQSAVDDLERIADQFWQWAPKEVADHAVTVSRTVREALAAADTMAQADEAYATFRTAFEAVHPGP